MQGKLNHKFCSCSTFIFKNEKKIVKKILLVCLESAWKWVNENFQFRAHIDQGSFFCSSYTLFFCTSNTESDLPQSIIKWKVYIYRRGEQAMEIFFSSLRFYHHPQAHTAVEWIVRERKRQKKRAAASKKNIFKFSTSCCINSLCN